MAGTQPASEQPPPSFWRRTERKILFHDHYRLLRTPYLISRAFIALGFGGAIDYTLVKLRSARRASEGASIGVRRGLRIHLRDALTDLGIFEQIMLLGDLRPVRPGAAPRMILDAGAHIGCASIYYALRYPGVRILAVEAADSNFRQLCRNVAQIQGIQPLHAAVFHRSGEVVIANPGDQAWGYQVGEPGAGAAPADSAIRAMTIRELMDHAGFPHLDILKLDIEGAEREIFESDAQSWLPLVRVINVELHDRTKPGCTESFERAVSGIPHESVRTHTNVVWINHSAA